MFNSNQLIWFMILINVHTLLAVIPNAIKNSTASAEGKLVMAQVISRHGNRTIALTYKTDPYQNATYWPEGFGQLTKIGNETEEAFGEYLRDRYDKLIGIFGRHKVFVESGLSTRNINSASQSSNGLFPISSIFKEKKIHIIPEEHDYLMKPSVKCRRFLQLYALFESSPAVQAQLQLIAPLRQYIELHSQSKLQHLVAFYIFYDAISIETMRGLIMPPWLHQIMPLALDTLEYFAALAMQGITSSTELKKMNAGFLLNRILNRFINFRTASLKDLEPEDQRILWLIESHDITLVTIMNALGVYKKLHVPPFGSSFHIEMYQRDNGEFYLQFFYRFDQTKNMPPIAIPFCGTQCPLDKFLALYQDILPNQYQTYNSLCI